MCHKQGYCAAKQTHLLVWTYFTPHTYTHACTRPHAIFYNFSSYLDEGRAPLLPFT